jgi:hypothetical protein
MNHTNKDMKHVTLKEPAATCWLSLESAMKAIHEVYPALVLALRVWGVSNSEAKGNFEKSKNCYFVLVTSFLRDILNGTVNKLCKIFQKRWTEHWHSKYKHMYNKRHLRGIKSEEWCYTSNCLWLFTGVSHCGIFCWYPVIKVCQRQLFHWLPHDFMKRFKPITTIVKYVILGNVNSNLEKILLLWSLFME